MDDQSNKKLAETSSSFENGEGTILNAEAEENPAIQRALRRLRESNTNDNHVSHYTKHTSHSTKHSSTW